MKNGLLAVFSGLILSFGWPTWGIPLLLFVGFVPLLIAERSIRLSNLKRKGWRVFGLAYLSFFIFNLLKTNWLWFSSEFGAAFAIIVNSLLMALLVLLYHHFAKRTSFFIASVFLASLWISFEKFHLNWDFSWPWLNLGNGFSEYYTWVQWYEYTGTFGGTLWIWIVNLSIFKTWLRYKKFGTRTVLIRGGLKNTFYILCPILISLWMYSSYEEKGDTVTATVLQPNIDPYSEKYNIDNNAIATLLFSLAEKEIDSTTDFVIAPETVFADNQRIDQLESSTLIKRLRAFVNKHEKVNFLAGISLYKTFTDKSQATLQTNVANNGVFYNTYNSAFMVSQKPQFDLYHKSKLVVGVESTPYVGIIKPILGDIMLDLGGTVAMKTTQEHRSVFADNSASYNVAPIICYESVYGEYVTGYVRNGANFLAIITNDAWWGETQGYKQHLSYARLRAIETRRSIARSANTGVSGFINQRGDIIKQLSYNTQGALTQTLFLNDSYTFYVRYGDIIYRIALFVLIGVVLIAFTRRRGDVGKG